MNPEDVNEACENYFWRVRVSENFEGDEKGKIEFEGKRFNLMGADYFMSGIIESLSELYAGAAGGIIRETGEEYGKEILEIVDDAEQAEGDERFGNFLGILQFLGYSQITAEKDRIRVKSSPTAEEHSEADYEEKKVCFFLAGILSGGYQEVYSSEANFSEEKCKADGDDECVFVKTEVQG